jgi:hypothetical protein
MMPRGGSGEMPTEEKDEEDLMGRYEYSANPTGGIRTPGSAFTGERVFFQPEYRRMFAAKGGEVKKFADGGEASASSSEVDPARGMAGESREAMQYLYDTDPKDPARTMTGASAEAMRYLLGQTESSRAPQPEQRLASPLSGNIMHAISTAPTGRRSLFSLSGAAPALEAQNTTSNAFTPPVRARSTISSTDDYNLIGSGPYAGLYESKTPKYVFDPGSQQFYRTDPVYKQQTIFDGFFGPSFTSSYGYNWYSEGGITELARGGMKAGGFVVPADVVSFVGEGNTDAGYERIKSVLPGATPIKGKDGGQADTVKTSIEGKQPARVAHGEMYVPPKTVEGAGGAKKLYAMMDKVRKQATGNKKQIKPVDIRKALA